MAKKNSKYKHDFEHFFCNTLGYNIMADKYQYEFVKAILDKDVQAVFSDSHAGSGKTSLSLSAAYYLLNKGEINSIVYVRNTVAVRDNGFLPGTIEDKELAYMRPAMDVIDRIGYKTNKQDLYFELLETKQIQCTSTSFLRGVDYEGDMVIIIDEAQNLDMVELQTVLTRPHDSVKVIVIGSSLQNDNHKIKKYGKEQLLPFQVYQKHFMDQKVINVRCIDLVNNYRGVFSQLADKIGDTIKKVDNGDCNLNKENSEKYGPSYLKVEEEKDNVIDLFG